MYNSKKKSHKDKSSSSKSSGKSKHSSNDVVWDKPIWSEQEGAYYCQGTSRRDGSITVEWVRDRSSRDAATPREAGIDGELAAGVGQISVHEQDATASSPEYSFSRDQSGQAGGSSAGGSSGGNAYSSFAGSAYTAQDAYGSAGGSGGHSSRSKSKSTEKSSSSKGSAGQPQHYQDEGPQPPDPFYGAGRSAAGVLSDLPVMQPVAGDETPRPSLTDEASALNHATASDQGSLDSAFGFDDNILSSSKKGKEPAVAAEDTESLDAFMTAGDSSARRTRVSSVTFAEPEAFPVEEDSIHGTDMERQAVSMYGGEREGESSSSAYADPGLPDEDADVIENTRRNLLASSSMDYSSNKGDPRYKVYPSKHYKPGAVFKIFWPTPLGQKTNPDGSSSVASGRGYSEHEVYVDNFGQYIYADFRRFIVVLTHQGHSNCVPIYTYERQGCKKRGVKPKQHGMIYQYGTDPPPLLDGEPKLGFKPVAIEIGPDNESLQRESRVNYSKSNTIEHNSAVYFIGRIYPSHFRIVDDAARAFWLKKSYGHMS